MAKMVKMGKNGINGKNWAKMANLRDYHVARISCSTVVNQIFYMYAWEWM